MTTSIRARTRNLIAAAAALLGTAGVVVVASLSSPANNLALDCSINANDAGVGSGKCRMLWQPDKLSRAQCTPLLANGGSPPFPGLDAGFPNAQVKVSRAAQAFLDNGLADSAYCEAMILDGGPDCWCDLTGTVSRDAAGKVDGQAAGWRDALDAQGAGSIVVDGRVSVRPAYAKRGGCRAHVFAGEDPCASSVGLDGGPEPDGGP